MNELAKRGQFIKSNLDSWMDDVLGIECGLNCRHLQCPYNHIQFKTALDTKYISHP